MSAQATTGDRYPFPEMVNAPALTVSETRDLVLRERAWRETGEVMSAKEARSWYEAKRARQQIEPAG